MPEILTLTPKPELSTTFHDKRTVSFAPMVTPEGAAVNKVMVGLAHALAVTATCAWLWLPQPAVAVKV
jgi:hypothetical protein